MISLATLKDFCGEYTSEYPSMSEIIHIKCKFVGIFFVLASITMKIPGHGVRRAVANDFYYDLVYVF